jgi:hypothetical protein
MPHSRPRSLRLLPLALAAGLVLGGCGGGDGSDDGGPAPAPASSGSASASGSASGSLDPSALDACNKVDEASRVTGDDVVSQARRTRLLLQAADSARQSSIPQIRDVPSLVGGAVAGSGGNALDQVRGICTGLGWTPS